MSVHKYLSSGKSQNTPEECWNTLLVVTMMRILRVVGPHAKLVIIDNDGCGRFDDDNDVEDNDWLNVEICC